MRILEEYVIPSEPLPTDGPPEDEPIPTATESREPVPEPTPMTAPMPDDIKAENAVTLGTLRVEIKPTKLKYFRNRMASAYALLKAIPLSDFLAFKKGTFDEKRSSDQILFDFLVAVFDDAGLVTQYYDDITSDDLEKILAIFGRVNHIEEKEEKARKNREAQATS